MFTALCVSGQIIRSVRPNILYFVVDDMGIADVGCFGNRTIPTPNVDRLCREGEVGLIKLFETTN